MMEQTKKQKIKEVILNILTLGLKSLYEFLVCKTTHNCKHD